MCFILLFFSLEQGLYFTLEIPNCILLFNFFVNEIVIFLRAHKRGPLRTERYRACISVNIFKKRSLVLTKNITKRVVKKKNGEYRQAK